MEIKSYRAKSVQEALAMVRADLGPDAAVLHTRELPPGMMRLLGATRQVEVIATAEAEQVPSRLPETTEPHPAARPAIVEPRRRFRTTLAASATGGMNLLPEAEAGARDAVSCLYQRLLAQQWPRDLADEYLQRLLRVVGDHEFDNEYLLQARLARLVEDELSKCRPIETQLGRCRTVALVGPTGVGKTTTIAKLAANFRIRQRKRVGLVTVDTFRVAAVDQLRSYADIIDLPMEIASTPEDLRRACQAMSGLDLILIDTAGRSPRDAGQLQQLRQVLAASNVDEIHLVLSTVSSTTTLIKAAELFSTVGVSSIVLTKLDEAHGLGNVFSLAKSCPVPFSYLTHGQNVPADIAPAERGRLARALVGVAAEAAHA